MPRGSKPGERRGGRKKGIPNKVTGDAREAFRKVYEGKLKELNRWLEEIAEGYECVTFTQRGDPCYFKKRDPAKAADLLLRMAEHFIPKLERVEHTGKDGDKLSVTVSISEFKKSRN